MDELKAGLGIILRAESDRDNFTDLDNLWEPKDIKPFYRALMFLICIKILLWWYGLIIGIFGRKEKSTINLLE